MFLFKMWLSENQLHIWLIYSYWTSTDFFQSFGNCPRKPQDIYMYVSSVWLYIFIYYIHTNSGSKFSSVEDELDI